MLGGLCCSLQAGLQSLLPRPVALEIVREGVCWVSQHREHGQWGVPNLWLLQQSDLLLRDDCIQVPTPTAGGQRAPSGVAAM